MYVGVVVPMMALIVEPSIAVCMLFVRYVLGNILYGIFYGCDKDEFVILTNGSGLLPVPPIEGVLKTDQMTYINNIISSIGISYQLIILCHVRFFIPHVGNDRTTLS